MEFLVQICGEKKTTVSFQIKSRLIEICFKFVSFFLKQSSEYGNSKTNPDFEQKRVMVTIIANWFDPKKKLLELNPTKLGLKPLIKF